MAGLAADSLGDLCLEVSLICSVCKFQQPFCNRVLRSTSVWGVNGGNLFKIQLHQDRSEFTQEDACNMDLRKSITKKRGDPGIFKPQFSA